MSNLRENIVISVTAIVVIWAVFLIDAILPVQLTYLGIRPRHLSGLWGILFSPFLHANLRHLMANTGALFILLLLALSYSRPRAIEAIIIIMVVGGGLVWLFGSGGTVHVGASGVIFGLIGFLLFSAVFTRDLKSFLVAIIVLFLYGGSMLIGFVPTPGVSWSGHAFGFLAGILAAWLFGRSKKNQTA